MLANVLVGLLTGAASSWAVAWAFYRYGRRDTRKSQWASQVDGILFRIAMLDPKRAHSVRPGDGVDDTSHSLLCSAAVLASIGFREGARLTKEIADDMVAQRPGLTTYDDGEKAKRGWEAKLLALREAL